MSQVKNFLQDLGLALKAEGSQWVTNCPECGKVAHCYVDKGTGLWHCKGCDEGGNPFQMVKHHRPDMPSPEIMKLLEEYGLVDGTVKKTKRPPKDLSYLRDKLRKPKNSEIDRMCVVRKLAPSALLTFRPLVHKTDPVMYLPGSVPGNTKYAGFLRVHLDGEMVETKNGPRKTPIIGGWGLLGIWAAQNAQTLVFAEGWADALCAIEAGYVAVANTGGTGWQPEWLPLFKGKDVIVVPDADVPGVKSAKARATAINKVAKSVKLVDLPYEVVEKGGQDLRDFLQGGGSLVELIDATSLFIPKTKSIILADDRPTTVAAKFEELSEVSHHYNSIDEWSIYSKNQYQQVRDDKEIEIHLLRFLSKCVVIKRKRDKDGWEEYTEKLKKQSGGYIRDVMRALRSMRSVHILPGMKAPSSFNGALNPETTIAMKNGLLDLSDMQNPKMTAFTPNFYTFNYLPIEYAPDRECPLWEGPCMGFYFTNEDGSPDAIALDVMYSWQKRFILRIVSPHKIFALIGDPRSGKSTAGRVIQAVIGAQNCTALTIASLSGPHGMHSLMNKQLGIMWDAQVAGRSQDVARTVQAIKMISGQDPIQVNPKCKNTIDLDSLPLNILMIANKPADLKDDTGVLATRFSFLKTTQSFLGHEDPTLEERIMAHELPGIFNKILAAPDTIVEHPRSAGMVQDYAEMTSPYTAFANDCCEIDPENYIPTDILWAYYCVWCDKFNHRKPSAQTFKINFSSAIRGIEKKQRRLTDGIIEELSGFHRLSFQGEPPLIIAQRPHCFVGIDIDQFHRGQWPAQHSNKRLDYGST